jgi:hypothetical protein
MKIFLLGLIAAVGVGVALAGATYAGLLRVPTDFFVGAPQQGGR